MQRVFVWGLVCGMVCLLSPGLSRAEDATATKRDQIVAKSLAFLRTKGQAENGSFSAAAGPGITALVATSMMRNGLSPDEPTVAKALKYVESFVQPDGSITTKESLVKNYETCLAIMCFSEANGTGKYTKIIKDAEKFIKEIQWDETENKNKEDLFYGGAGYGNHKRPDLSNTTFLVDALKAAGAGPEDPALQRAIIFVSRTQNLESEFNTTPFAAKINDGGFYYTPAAGGTSQAQTTENGGLRSYGSMTYAGLRSLIFAGVKADDPRVKAATTWLAKHYTLKENPGLGKQGQYYYYHSFAKCLDALGHDTFTDDKGVKHDWRAELVEELASKQKEDGSFVNDADRWMEGDPNLVTGYVLLALSHVKAPASAASK